MRDSQIKTMPFRRILVRAANWVGDAVMSIPALQALREKLPSAQISILARPWVAGLYGREPFCDELIPYEAPRDWRGTVQKWEIARDLRRRHFDSAILLQNAFESAALVRVAGVPVRIGYARDARGWLLTHPIPVPKPGETPKHQRFYYLELLKRAQILDGYETDGTIRLHGAHAAAQAGQQILEKYSLRGPVIGVAPGAAYGGAKRWLPERFGEAAARLAGERGGSIAIFGSKEEWPICNIVHQYLQKGGQQSINFAGKTSLSEFIEMVASCELLLTNDSGPMHIASALGVPTVAVFGATDHEATGPTGVWSRVVREPVECSPCLLRECPIDHRCMLRVGVERVAQEASELLALHVD
jgi:heptosyltransferase-2